MLSNNLSIAKIRNDDIILAQFELFTWGNGGDNEPNMTESPNFYVCDCNFVHSFLLPVCSSTVEKGPFRVFNEFKKQPTRYPSNKYLIQLKIIS